MSDIPTNTEQRILNTLHDLNVQVSKLARDIRELSKDVRDEREDANRLPATSQEIADLYGASVVTDKDRDMLKGLGITLPGDET